MKLSPLAQRLARMDQFRDASWTVLAENVPVWPAVPPVPTMQWTDGDNAYGPSQGTAELLDALALRGRAQGAALGPESLLVTNGGFDALALITRRLHTRGIRRVICAGPVLSSVVGLFESIGVEPVVLAWDDLFTGERWRGLGCGATDAFYLNTPHNPTGACLAEDVAKQLLADQQRFGFQLILDLVYDSFCFQDGCSGSPLAWVGNWQGVYAFNSFSKSYGAPGLRVGWLMAEPAVIPQLTAQFEMERIAVSTTAQTKAAALCALGNRSLVDAVRRGRKLVLDWAAAERIEIAAGHGGTQLWVDLQVGDSERFADLLMERERVVVTTGANYHPVQPRYIRLPTGLDTATLTSGLEAIERVRRGAGAADLTFSGSAVR
ncbi:beta-methylarginine biosynthesis bifunctional aminotransferase [Kitasatospora kazusensis]|uniref:Aminotransferase n=1 Tax=Kitasatospora kazusensis TaxID=407974 RepID=A0ABN2ZAN3_9ACTN